MKTKIFFIAAFLLLGIYAVQAQEWGYVNTLTDEYMRKIWTQGLDTVYIVGENGLIARSTDQGETWGKQYFPTKVALNDIIFTDYYTGFAVGEQGMILKTSDAGETWKQIPIDAASNLNAIAATGLDNIWAVGDNSLILHSTDAGETWEQENILPANNIQLTDIAFRGSLGCFTGDYGTIYKTEDYGITWNKQIISDGYSIYDEFHSLNVTNKMIYVLSFGSLFYFIEDKETNWTKGYVPTIDNGGYMHFTNDSTGYLIGRLPVPTGGSNSSYFCIFTTTDKASNWTPLMTGDYKGASPLSYYYDYYDLNFANDTVGYAIINSMLLKTPAEPFSPPDPESINTITTNSSLILHQNANDLIVSCMVNAIKLIELLDVHGRSLKKQSINNNENYQEKINISGIPTGVYLVKTTLSDGKVYTKKWVKQ